ncbi:hypothetical protein ABK046_45315, partial [Streptomyces caeruleatus]
SFAPKGHASRDYDVRYLPGVMAGQQVNAQVNAYRAPAIDVRYTDAETGEICWLTLEPLVRDANGFVQSAPVVGERYARPPLTVADRARQASGRRAY